MFLCVKCRFVQKYGLNVTFETLFDWQNYQNLKKLFRIVMTSSFLVLYLTKKEEKNNKKKIYKEDKKNEQA